jgi:anaerobic selenocysteine-containing dehydrogenase
VDVDRRGFLIAAGLAALAPLALTGIRWRTAATASAQLFRPDTPGSSTSVCSRCGTWGHNALDPNCPANVGPRCALQEEARAKTAATAAGLADGPGVAAT